MVGYYFWEDNKVVRAKSIVEIRKRFIQKWGKNKVANIYKNRYSGVAGHLYYATGSWIYKDYSKHKAYVIRENGKAEYELQYMLA